MKQFEQLLLLGGNNQKVFEKKFTYTSKNANKSLIVNM